MSSNSHVRVLNGEIIGNFNLDVGDEILEETKQINSHSKVICLVPSNSHLRLLKDSMDVGEKVGWFLLWKVLKTEEPPCIYKHAQLSVRGSCFIHAFGAFD